MILLLKKPALTNIGEVDVAAAIHRPLATAKYFNDYLLKMRVDICEAMQNTKRSWTC